MEKKYLDEGCIGDTSKPTWTDTIRGSIPRLVRDNGQSYALVFFDSGYTGKDLHSAITTRKRSA